MKVLEWSEEEDWYRDEYGLYNRLDNTSNPS